MENQRKHRDSSFIIQGSILAMASIIVRLIGIAYRIPLTNIIGDEGNGYYAAAFDVYSILLLLSSYSLPLAVSKLVAARVAMGERKNAYRIFRCALIFAVAVGGFAALVTYFTADFFAGKVMAQAMSGIALRVLAPTLFIVAVMGVIRGYFQGLGTMVPTALSQIIEGIVNAVVSVGAAYYLFSYGAKVDGVLNTESYAEAYGAAGGTLGTGAGALFGLIFLILVTSAYKKVLRKQMKKDTSRRRESYSQIYRLLFLTITPVILSTAVYNISGVLDQGMFNNVLSGQGYPSKEVASLWGIFSNKYKLLINMPIAIASALCASVIPSISGAVAEGNDYGVKRKIYSSIRVTMLIAIPSAVGLGVLASPILQLLFNDASQLPANLLRAGSVAVVFYSLSTLTNGILQGINRMKLPVRHASISLVLHLILLFIMIYFFKWHVYGVVYANVFFALLMCVMNGLSIRRHLGYSQEVKKTFLIPSVSAAMMGICVYLVHRGLHALLNSNTAATIAAIMFGFVVYGTVLLYLRGMDEEEILALPKGKLIYRIARRLHLV